MSKLQYTDAHYNKVVELFSVSAQAAHAEFGDGKCHKCPLYTLCASCDADIDNSEVK